jgi:transglutaminase-like putative cysteine protease
LAAVLGWGLGSVERKGGLIFVLGVLTGLGLLISIQSKAYLGLYAAYRESLQIQIRFRPLLPAIPNTGTILYHLFGVIDRLSTYVAQVTTWLVDLTSGRGQFNLLSAYFVWGNALWTVSFTLGWLLRRKVHVFLASLPALSLVVGVIGFTRRSTAGLTIAFSAFFALMILMEHLKRESRWETLNIDYSEELRFDLIGVTVPLVALIMIIASLVPRISLDKIRSYFKPRSQVATLDQSNIPESLGLDQTPLDSISGPTTPSLPRSHLIGSGPELSERVVLEIDIGETHLPPQIDPLGALPKFYWFGRTFEIYTGSGWQMGEIRQERVPAGQEIYTIEAPYYDLVEHTITKTSQAPPSLYFSGVLHIVDQGIIAAWHETTGEFYTAQLDATGYQVSTYKYDFTTNQLNQFTDDPPAVILDTYLAIPPETPARVLELGATLTEPASTPYEKAKRIEAFLRQFEYTLDLPLPPQDRDLVDYFIFDLQKGYCDYYASAMVILARASGLPARLAVGYASGTYDYNRQVFVVTEAQAHAWPEIYLEPVGWVPFEPTASYSAYAWPDEFEGRPALEEPLPPMPTRVDDQKPSWQDAIGLALLVGLIIIFGFIWLYIFRRRGQAASETFQIESIHQKMRTHLQQVFFELHTEHTPLELFTAYSTYFQQAERPKFIQRMSRDQIRNIQTITNLYVTGVYSPQVLHPEHIKQAKRELFRLMIRSWQLKAAYFLTNS